MQYQVGKARARAHQLLDRLFIGEAQLQLFLRLVQQCPAAFGSAVACGDDGRDTVEQRPIER